MGVRFVFYRPGYGFLALDGPGAFPFMLVLLVVAGVPAILAIGLEIRWLWLVAGALVVVDELIHDLHRLRICAIAAASSVEFGDLQSRLEVPKSELSKRVSTRRSGLPGGVSVHARRWRLAQPLPLPLPVVPPTSAISRHLNTSQGHALGMRVW